MVNGTWTSGVPVIVSVDGLPVGSYNYTIIATNSLGDGVQNTVNVMVLLPPPAFTNHPINVSYAKGTKGNTISWNITDSDVGTTSYTIFRNGTQVANGTWASGVPVSINVDGLAVGSYNYTIIVSNGLGSHVEDTVIAKVFVPPNAGGTSSGGSTIAVMVIITLAAGGIVISAAMVTTRKRRVSREDRRAAEEGQGPLALRGSGTWCQDRREAGEPEEWKPFQLRGTRTKHRQNRIGY